MHFVATKNATRPLTICRFIGIFAAWREEPEEFM
jgi:hypothetical protein